MYYPPNMRPDTPILVFSYSSGFYMAAPTLPTPAFIIYHNLGSFFTSHGFITIIPNYCLVDLGVQFPGAVQDMQDAMQWVMDNLPSPDSDIYVLGHSAGVMNMFIILTLPELYSPSLQPHIKGVVFLSGPYTFEDMPVDMKDSVRLYYGEDDEAKQGAIGIVGISKFHTNSKTFARYWQEGHSLPAPRYGEIQRGFEGIIR
ncbi:uncharacterized protein EV420DRAFT_1701399 [Desarmillaria tabescens]|uniref:BD-FAE-like domain-containing protein n=1 Tax=Armillaria tabescens TaxID=1929756 RepID=A0AA39MZR1_ARMTA|nr:uncharacterized protein EV420DRAFT_1701399 [Desarmillaria tabescens]KAK0452059.1 hypothetical protein EV420DRAFT_1701399 [Desarmillaria tabescens]